MRTHNRSEQLKTCLTSIAQCNYADTQVIIVSDNDPDPVEDIAAATLCHIPWVRFKPKPHSWPPNDYFNQIHHLVEGHYTTYIDDDDRVFDRSYYSEILKAAKQNPHMMIWRANLGKLYHGNKDTILPENHNWGKRPVLSHFSTLNMGVLSEYAKNVSWPQRKGGDGLFAQSFWDRYISCNPEKVIFIDKVLTGTQNGLSTHKRERA